MYKFVFDKSILIPAIKLNFSLKFLCILSNFWQDTQNNFKIRLITPQVRFVGFNRMFCDVRWLYRCLWGCISILIIREGGKTDLIPLYLLECVEYIVCHLISFLSTPIIAFFNFRYLSNVKNVLLLLSCNLPLLLQNIHTWQ